MTDEAKTVYNGHVTTKNGDGVHVYTTDADNEIVLAVHVGATYLPIKISSINALALMNALDGAFSTRKPTDD